MRRFAAMRSTTSILFLLACLLGAPLYLTCFQQVFSETPASDPLPRDASNTYGKLENGFQYVIRKHSTPPGRVALYLHVKAGALNETAVQNGLAHFLEHMCFNGSKHFAPGTLIPRMNELGMQFGADSNAHTTYHETVYKLFMPGNSDALQEEAFTILSDFASELSLSAEEIDKERGVVLEEATAHKGAQQRILEELAPKIFPGSLWAEHTVIGKDEQLRTFPRDQFADFWSTWYRPELMTLIVVGDVEGEKIIEKTKKWFGVLKARAPARAAPPTGLKTVAEPRAFVIADAELPQGVIQMMRLQPGRPPIDTYRAFYMNEVENMGTWIVSRRFQDLLQKGEAKYMMCYANVEAMLHDLILPQTMAMGDGAQWKEMLQQSVRELKRAIEHGFTAAELELAKKEIISNAEDMVSREPTLEAGQVINWLSGAIGVGEPIISAQQRLDLLRRVVAAATLDEVHKVFVENFDSKNYTYVLALPKTAEITLPTTEEVLKIAADTWGVKTDEIAAAAKLSAILPELPEPGSVASRTSDDELGITTLTLSNGAIVHHRFMDYKRDSVFVQILFPGGSIEETAETRGLSEVASLVNATSRLSSSQIRDCMVGLNVGVQGGFGLDAGFVAISGQPKDLEAGFQLAYAMITDGKIEQSAFDTWKKGLLLQLEEEKSNPQAQLGLALEQVFYAGDLRFQRLGPEQLEKLTPAAAEQWMHAIVKRSPVEVTIVGDITLDKVLPMVTRYVGSLPKATTDFKVLDPLRKLKRGDGPYARRVDVETITPQAIVLAGYVGCDDRSVRERRLLNLAGMILSERMLKTIREEQQLVYSIRCTHQPAKEIPETGLFFAYSSTEPPKAETLANTILEMMKEFAKAGPTAAEVETAQKQVLTMLENQLREPTFWLTQLGDMQYRGRTFDEMKGIGAMYQTFTAEEVKAVAAKYITDKRQIRFLAVPKEAATEGAKSDAMGKETPASSGK